MSFLFEAHHNSKNCRRLNGNIYIFHPASLPAAAESLCRRPQKSGPEGPPKNIFCFPANAAPQLFCAHPRFCTPPPFRSPVTGTRCRPSFCCRHPLSANVNFFRFAGHIHYISVLKAELTYIVYIAVRHPLLKKAVFGFRATDLQRLPGADFQIEVDAEVAELFVSVFHG